MKGYGFYIVMGAMALAGIPLFAMLMNVRNKKKEIKEDFMAFATIVIITVTVMLGILGFMGKLDLW